MALLGLEGALKHYYLLLLCWSVMCMMICVRPATFPCTVVYCACGVNRVDTWHVLLVHLFMYPRGL